MFPYIEISNPKIKLLIDTGSSWSIIKPFIIKNSSQTEYNLQQLLFPQALVANKYNTKQTFQHFPNLKKLTLFFITRDYFEGVFGLRDIINLNLNIDLIK